MADHGDPSIASALAMLRATFVRGPEKEAITEIVCGRFGKGHYRWLDIGVGDGTSTSWVLEKLDAQGRNFVVAGIDPELEPALHALSRREGAVLKRIAAESYEPDQAFDVINLRQSGYYIASLLDFVHRISGALTPEGLLLITHWTASCMLFQFHTIIAKEVSAKPALTAEEIRDLLNIGCSELNAGLRVFEDSHVDVRRIQESDDLKQALFRLSARTLPVHTLTCAWRQEITSKFLNSLPPGARRSNGLLVVSRRVGG
jgi:SAM-dependent methyltransferase